MRIAELKKIREEHNCSLAEAKVIYARVHGLPAPTDYSALNAADAARMQAYRERQAAAVRDEIARLKRCIAAVKVAEFLRLEERGVSGYSIPGGESSYVHAGNEITPVTYAVFRLSDGSERGFRGPTEQIAREGELSYLRIDLESAERKLAKYAGG
jgi:hypothetical protein